MLQFKSRTIFQKLLIFFRRQTYTMEEFKSAFVRRVVEEERMQIRLTYFHGTLNLQRTFNMDRMQSEEVGRALERLQFSISKYLTPKMRRKRKKGGSDEVIDSVHVPISLRNEQQQEIDGTILNTEAWIHSNTLQIGDQLYNIEVNPPAVLALKLPEVIMAGCITHPEYTLEFANDGSSVFEWYKCNSNNETGSPPKSKADTDWSLVNQGALYTPSDSDINAALKVICIPRNAEGDRQGEPVEAISKAVVQSGPGVCPFEKRHLYTKTRSEHGSFRVMSYNILADLYADSDFSRDQLFPYCPANALKMDYRKHLLIKEITGYNADIICLQECDRKLFKNDLFPVLSLAGFQGEMRCKKDDIPEGCAIFYMKDKFRSLDEHGIHLTEAFNSDDIYRDLKDKVSQNTVLNEKLQNRHTMLQVTVLESLERPGHKLCVANTHLYFHPKSPNIRLLQTIVCLRYIARLKQQYGEDMAVVFCGDFNCTPERGVYELITKKFIAANHNEWFAGGKEELVDGLELRHDLSLYSACGTPLYTNYVSGFSGCLDYVFISDMLGVTQVIPMPSHEEVTSHTALPNTVFPSDHIAVVCDVTWT